MLGALAGIRGLANSNSEELTSSVETFITGTLGDMKLEYDMAIADSESQQSQQHSTMLDKLLDWGGKSGKSDGMDFGA